MNELKVFSYESNEVRTVIIDGKPWWIAKDVCDVLHLTNPSEAVKPIGADDLSTAEVIDSIGRKQKANIINESGLYTLIMRSDKPEAKAFQKWITSKVLPSIRKTGEFKTRHKQIRDKSKKIRNQFTDVLRDHGCTKPGHYIQITKSMKAIQHLDDKKKDEYTEKELIVNSMAEDLAMYQMIDHESIGYPECRVESDDATRRVVGLIEETKRSRIGA